MTRSLQDRVGTAEADGGEPCEIGTRGRRSRRALFLALGGTVLLAACGRKPATLLPPGSETEDEFPTRYPRY